MAVLDSGDNTSYYLLSVYYVSGTSLDVFVCISILQDITHVLKLGNQSLKNLNNLSWVTLGH